MIPPTSHYWIDDLNPWVFRFSENLGIRWYGVAYVIGIAFAAYVFSRWAKQKRLPISVDEVYTLPVYAALGAVLGGRIGHCLFYNLSEVSRHPLEVLAIWHGGMASQLLTLPITIAIALMVWRSSANGYRKSIPIDQGHRTHSIRAEDRRHRIHSSN